MGKIILDLCGGTGAWSKPYKDAGYDVRLITLPENDIFSYTVPDNVYGILAAPTCTHFSYARTRAKTPRDLESAMSTVSRCLEIIWECSYRLKNEHSRIPILKFWALENPDGFLKFFLGKPVFQFHPFDFGDRYQKTTQLWGNFNFPVKKPIILNREEKKKFQNQSQLLPKFNERDLFNPDGYEYHPGCGQDRRAVRRSITPPGFAKAFFNANK